MFILIAAFIGLVMNRVRGGGLTDFSWKENWINEKDESFIKPFSKILHDFVFASLFAFALGAHFDTTGIKAFILLYAAMLSGRSMGWGVYIDGIIRREVKDEEEIAFIDKLFLQKKDHPVLRNVAALSVRGMIWTTCLFLGTIVLSELGFRIPSSVFAVPFLGLLMGLVYLVSIGFCQQLKRFKLIDLPAWGFSECVWGFVLWGGYAKLILGA